MNNNITLLKLSLSRVEIMIIHTSYLFCDSSQQLVDNLHYHSSPAWQPLPPPLSCLLLFLTFVNFDKDLHYHSSPALAAFASSIVMFVTVRDICEFR